MPNEGRIGQTGVCSPNLLPAPTEPRHLSAQILALRPQPLRPPGPPVSTWQVFQGVVARHAVGHGLGGYDSETNDESWSVPVTN